MNIRTSIDLENMLAVQKWRKKLDKIYKEMNIHIYYGIIKNKNYIKKIFIYIKF